MRRAIGSGSPDVDGRGVRARSAVTGGIARESFSGPLGSGPNTAVLKACACFLAPPPPGVLPEGLNGHIPSKIAGLAGSGTYPRGKLL